ncbi:MAG: oligosaccharide flippase family protein [Patescibacteria group bacterium]
MFNSWKRKVNYETIMKINNFTDLRTLLLDNKTTEQTIFKNTTWLTIGTIISRLLKLVLVIYVARILGATEYGKFNFALAFISLFLVFSNLGLPAITVREFAQSEERKKEFYSILSLKIILSLGVLILIFFSSLFITPDETTRRLIWILTFFVLIDSFYSIINCFFNAYQRMEYEAFGVILNAVITTGAGLFVIFNFPSVINLSYAYLLGSIIVLVFSLIILHLKFLPFRLYWEKKVWRRFLFMSWPLAAASLFGSILNNTDSAMLGYFGEITETGWYGAAYRIINIVFLPMGLVTGSFFPVLSKFAAHPENMLLDKIKEAKEKLQKVWNYDLKIMILIAIPLMVGGVSLAPGIIKFIYGQSFLPSILAFQILIIMAGIVFLYVPFSDILVASGQQKRVFWVTLSGAITNFILNLIFIPRFSLYGAAGTTVVTNLLMFFLFFKLTSKFTQVRPWDLKIFLVFIGASLSSALMYLVITQPKIHDLNIFFLILTGAIIYLLALFASKFLIDYSLNYLTIKRNQWQKKIK